MSRSLLLTGVALLGLAAPRAAAQAPATTDSEAQRLIERLLPTEQQTRGIRMPGTDSGTVTPAPTLRPAPAAAPMLVPAAPMPGAPTANVLAPNPAPAAPPVMGSAPSAMPTPAPAIPPPAVARDTTAPAGMAAVSITVNFATASHALSPQAAMALTSLGRALASPELRPFRFRIEGHTDTEGDAAMNMLLAERRATAVREFLLKSFPIAPFRLIAVGMGEAQLLVPTPDNMPEPRNRRVQIINLGG